MTDRTIQLIHDFKPEPVNIPFNKCELEEAVEAIYTSMFPVCECNGTTNISKELYNALEILHKNIIQRTDKPTADRVVEGFMESLPSMRHRLFKDAQCYVASDPAAKSIEEVILTYPGFFALSIHRLAHLLHNLGKPLIARYFSEYAHSKVGIDIHPAAKIGKNLFMDHGTGIVIGETCEIGDNVKIYQGVTLGALYVEKKLSDVKRHPTVEDNVVIYANATILGGKTIVGHDSIIGGGAWLTKSIIPYSRVYNSVDVKIRTAKDFNSPFDYVI